MSFSGVNGLNNKIQQLFASIGMQKGMTASVFGSLFPNVSSDIIEKMLQQGMSKKSIVSQLIAYANTNDSDISKVFESEITDIVSEIENEIKQNSDNKNPQNSEKSEKDKRLEEENSTQNSENIDTVQVDHKVDSEDNNNSQNPENVSTPVINPIEDDYKDWNVADAGTMFNENITQKQFLQNFNHLSETLRDNHYSREYISAIEDAGAENFFNAIDTNKDGKLDKEELASVLNADGDNTSISAAEFNNILNQIPENSGDIPEGAPVEVPVKPEVQTPDEVEDTKTKKPEETKDKKHHSNDSSTDLNTEKPQEEKKETVEDLINQKHQIISEADTKIAGLNQQINDLIKNSDIEQTLKDSYNSAKESFDSNQKTISENETQIETYNTNIHSISTSLAALEGEKSTLDTNTDDAEVNKNNSERKTEIDSKIKELETEKAEIEGKKRELESTNQKLKTDSATLQKAVDDSFAELQNALPEEIKTQISEIQTKIQTIETQKTTDVNEIDAKIEALKTQEVKDSRESGEAVGKLASNPIGAKFVQDALKYLGTKGGSQFSTGDYGWCADFVTYVVKEVATEMGMTKEEVKELRQKHLGASPQKLAKKNQGHVIETEGLSADEISRQIQPGMAFICRGGGQSGQHTGFVAEVYDDGTFLTIEGNNGNMVRQNVRNIKDMYRFVDFTYLFT